MKNIFSCLVLTASILFFMFAETNAQWVHNGSFGDDVLTFAISGTNLFAGTNGGGILLSTDNGTSWKIVNNGLTYTYVHALAVSGTDLFAGVADGGVFLSTNNGTSWTAVNSGLTNTYVRALAVIGTNLFAGTLGGVFLSTNNGTSWTAVKTGLTVIALAVSGTNLFVGVPGGDGVYLSTNNGASWSVVNTGLTNTIANAFAVSGTNLFDGTGGGGVFLSTNNGTSWTAVNTGLTNTDIHAFAVSGTNLFAGTEGGIFLSTNNGTSWIEVNTGLTNTIVNALAVSGTNLFAGTAGGGVWRRPLSEMIMSIPQVTLISPNGGENFIAGIVDTIKWTSTNISNVKLEYTTNSGTNWSTIIASTPASSGIYAWLIPTVSSTNCKARISDVTNSSLSDTGDNVFSINYVNGYDSITYGGKIYHTVKIGTQTWLKENLDVGTMIQVNVNASNNGTIEKYCYDNNPENCKTYGGLYSWNEAIAYSTTPGPQGICPTGWHIPTKPEFQELATAVSNNANSLKTVGQGTGVGAGTNTSGFSALLAGFRDFESSYVGLGDYAAYFWSSTEHDAVNGDGIGLYYDNSTINMYNGNKGMGFSIRCLKNESTVASVQIISPNGGEIFVAGTVDTIKWTSTNISNVKLEYTTNSGTNWSTIIASTPASSGIYAWLIPTVSSTNCKVRISDVLNSTLADTSDNVFAINYVSGYDSLVYGGKTYHTVKIGTQTWLKENLDVGTYVASTNTGTAHSDVTNNGIIEKYCYGNNEANCGTYGGLYDWNEAMAYSTTSGTKGICPTGWHIPTKTELETLKASVGNDGNKLKREDQGMGSGVGTNTSGFSALLAGFRYYYGNFSQLGDRTDFWSSTESIATSAYYLYLNGNDSSINLDNTDKDLGFRVRCLKDESATASIQIISPNGGENLVVGTVDTIKWTSSIVTNVKLEYTTDNGTNWISIVATTPASAGSYAWTIPNTPSTNCKVRVSDASNSTISDVSDNTFKIILQNGLVAHYPFNGNSNDTSGYGNNIININAVAAQDRFGASGKSYYFDGSQSRMYRDVGEEFRLGNNFTLSAWINVSGNGTDSPRLVAVGPLSTSANYYAIYIDMATRRIGFYLPSPLDPVWSNYVTGTSEGWKLVTATYDGTTVKIYIDNKLDVSSNVSHNFPAFSSARLQIGYSENYSFPTDLFNGKLDDIRIYNRALTQTEIDSLYIESATSSILVTSPNGGETWQAGSTQNITWTSSNVTNVKLDYTTDNGTSWATIIASTPASGDSYAWLVPNTPSTNCKVKVSDVSNSNIVSSSNFVFTIAQPTQNYFSDGFENGLSNWIVSGQDWGLTNTTSRGGSYCITESPNENYGINGNFIIVLANAIDLSTSTNPILTFWHKYYSEFYDYCRVDISKDGGTTWSELERYNYTQNSWTQEQLDLSSYKVKNIKIRFRFTSDSANNYDGWYIDDVEIKENNLDQKLPFPFSDGFENGLDNWIVSGKDWGRINTEARSGSYCITESPVGTYSINSNIIISLAKTIDLSTSTNPILMFWHKYYSEFYDYCRVDISIDGGNTWAELKKFNYTQNSWTMEQLDLNNYKSKYVKIRFRFTSDLANNYDGWYIDDVMVKDAIAKYTLLTSPNGSESWQAGSTQNITWTSANVTNVKLEYTTDNGTDWISIVATTPASAGSYAWTIPNTPSTQCKVKISDVDNSLIADTSGIFTIAVPIQKITVTSPNGGEKWNVGSTQNIIWTSDNVTNVKLEYTTDSGTSWSTIIASTPASVGSYQWIVPNALSTQCKVRVSDASQASIYDLSDSAFVILDDKIPNILVSVNSLDFGNVYKDSTNLKQINLTNTGTADLQIQSTSFYQASSAYKVSTFNQTIKPDSIRKVSISFTPTQIASYPDTLYVYHNATGNPSKISLSGLGIDVAKPVIKIAVTSITFDTTYVGSNNQKTLSITNEGTADLVVSSITANKAVFTSSESSFIVGAGLNHLITLTFSPTSDSGYSGTLAIQHNALGSPSLLSLTGKGKKHAPNIVLSSKEINFGVITVNSNYETSLLINNTGTADLVVTNIHSSNSIFVTVETNFMVAPNSSQEVHLKFTPLVATQYTGTLTISHNAESGVTTIPMTGAGYPVQVSVARTISFGDITRSGNYRMISLPGNSNIPITQTVSGVQKTDWNAYYDNGILSASQSDYLKEYDGSPNFTFKPGNGFWIISKNGFTVSENVAPVLLAADSTYAIPLQANWNIISNPFEKSTSWTKIKQLNGLTTDPLYKWNGQTYDQVSEVTTYEGFYFLNNKGLSTLKIPYDANGTLRKFFKEKDNYLLGERGFIINCFDSGVEKSFVYVGFNTKASNDVDDYDYFMPPVDFGEVSLVLQNDSLSSDYKKLMIEQRKEIGEGTQFDFTAKNISKDAVQLSVNGFEFFPESETYLLDKQYIKFTNLKEKNVFILPPQMGKRGYSLLVGSQAFIQERKAATTPKEYLLYQNYPNPFNPVTTIAFGLPKESNVTLMLYNTLGEVVLKNELGSKTSGYHELLLDLRSNPSGVYFYRLSAESLDGKQKYSSIKKMILLK